MSANYIITSSGVFASEEELYHYGVLGMKWGQRKANRLSAANDRYLKKALKFDAKSAKLYKKAEKQHSENDLGRSNKAATKAAKMRSKIASNKAYSNMMKQRMDSLDREKLRKVQEPLSSYIKESFHKE